LPLRHEKRLGYEVAAWFDEIEKVGKTRTIEKVKLHHEIKGPGGGLITSQIRLDPLDRDTCFSRLALGVPESVFVNVDGDDVGSALRRRDRLAATATRQIQDAHSRCDQGGVPLEPRIRNPSTAGY
jgi:hypothetical protein